jgi:putative hydrolase of the HAD superfamily
MKRPACIVFDVDDTLYLERDYVRSGFDAVGAWIASEQGVDGFAAAAWRQFTDGARNDIFNRALADVGLPADEATVAALVRIYRRHAPAIALTADARTALQQLSGRVRIGALTDGPVESQSRKVTALGLPRWIHPIVLTGALGPGRGKPSPHGFSLIEQAHGLSGAACLYVADNPAKDFGGPKALGWRTLRVRRDGGLHAAVPSGSDVDFETGDITEGLRLFFNHEHANLSISA